jgi:hypothetical protein
MHVVDAEPFDGDVAADDPVPQQLDSPHAPFTEASHHRVAGIGARLGDDGGYVNLSGVVGRRVAEFAREAPRRGARSLGRIAGGDLGA